MIILLNLPTSEWTTAHARYIFRKGGSGTVTFDMYTSTDHLWQYVDYTIKRARTTACGGLAPLILYSGHLFYCALSRFKY